MKNIEKHEKLNVPIWQKSNLTLDDRRQKKAYCL